MGLNKITNFVETAQRRLIQQDKERVNTNKLVGSFVSEIQEAENAMYDVYKNCGIFTAIGAQLDIIGKLVGEARQGRPDNAYRIAIIARIKLNVSAGEPDSIIDAIKQLMDTEIVDFSEPNTAYFTVFIQSLINIPNITSIVKEMSPAGVNSTISVLKPNYVPFVFTTTKGTPATFQVQPLEYPGFELYDFEVVYAPGQTATLEVLAQDAVNISAGEGFATAYPTRSILTVDNLDTEYDIGDGSVLELRTINDNENYTISNFGGRWATVKI
jgi:hypothetical protein